MKKSSPVWIIKSELLDETEDDQLKDGPVEGGEVGGGAGGSPQPHGLVGRTQEGQADHSLVEQHHAHSTTQVLPAQLDT